jgi:iron complex transport system permease protein
VAARRTVLVGAALAAAAVATALGSLMLGQDRASITNILRALAGRGDTVTRILIVDISLPRVVLAFVVGLALGLSGAIYQGVTQNPLVSPDVMGINAGASVVVVALLLYGPIGPSITRWTWLFALIGALATALLVYVLAFRRGGSRYRIVLVGVGINIGLTTAVTYMVYVSNVYSASQFRQLSADFWLSGSLAQASWRSVTILTAALLITAPPLIAAVRSLAALELGDYSAAALGVDVRRSRLVLLGCATALAAISISVVGPLGLAAFISPHIARRVIGRAGPALPYIAALIGALLVMAADDVGQWAAPPNEIPAGLLTAVIGGPYLLYLLFKSDAVSTGA